MTSSVLLLAALAAAPSPPAPAASPRAAAAPGSGPRSTIPGALRQPGEVHIANLRQLTFGGENAEAYWSPDGRKLVFQSTRPPHSCDQIYVLDLTPRGGEPKLVSTGKGRTTCSYFLGNRILFSSTHHLGPDCPPPPDRSRGYVWPLHDYDIFTVAGDGSGGLARLTDSPGYDAEATVSADGSRIVFTSTRDGDLELYTMAPDGSDVRRITRAPGYDGGAFFSRDGSRIVYRSHRPAAGAALDRYRTLLADKLVEPRSLEIMVIGADGRDERQVTSNGAANFAPYWHPDGKRIIFASNLADPKGRDFDLYLVRDDGSGLERITFDPSFDGFPMFSPDGRRLVWASNRRGAQPGETNLFLADWRE